MVTVTTPKVHMGTITGGEARELYATNPVVFLPIGSHEDQGPHAPMGDYLLCEKIAEIAAVKASTWGTRTVVAPVIPFGADDFFAPMIGGVPLAPATMTAVLTDVFAAFERHGLTRVVVINGHGGNEAPVARVSREIYRRTKRIVPRIYLWKNAYTMLPEILGPDVGKRVSGHGADPLTSIGLHLFPEMIRRDLIPEAKPLKRETTLDLPFASLGALSFQGAEIGVPHEYDEVYNEGVSRGDPTLCRPETGAALVERLSDLCANFAALFASRT